MSRDVGTAQAGDTFQLNGGGAAIDRDVGVTARTGDIVIVLQVGQGSTFHVQLILSGHKIRDDGMATLLGREELEEVVAGAGAAGHGVIAGAADERIGARRGAALHDSGARAGDELIGAVTAEQGRATAHRHEFMDPTVTVDCSELASAYRGAAVRTVHRRLTVLDNSVVTHSEGDGVMTTEAAFRDAAGSNQIDGVVAVADRDIAAQADGNGVIPVSSFDQAPAIHINRVVAASREHRGTAVHRYTGISARD